VYSEWMWCSPHCGLSNLKKFLKAKQQVLQPRYTYYNQPGGPCVINLRLFHPAGTGPLALSVSALIVSIYRIIVSIIHSLIIGNFVCMCRHDHIRSLHCPPVPWKQYRHRNDTDSGNGPSSPGTAQRAAGAAAAAAEAAVGGHGEFGCIFLQRRNADRWVAPRTGSSNVGRRSASPPPLGGYLQSHTPPSWTVPVNDRPTVS
jgi:hypothetical protein